MKMKRTGYLISEIADKKNLYLAFWKACRGKHQKAEVIAYKKNLHTNICQLQQEITEAKPHVGNYHYFFISDPKLRQICAASFPERILHHALMNVCHPYFERNLISDSYATRIGKGTYKAIAKAKLGMKNYRFVAKLDVRKYFDSVSHPVLKRKLALLFKDKKLLSIFNQIIDSYSTSQQRGIPIGNLTSQYFANYYLSAADHYAKEILQIPVYIRYMDDILLFGKSRQQLKEQVQQFISFVSEDAGLVFKVPIINSNQQGTSFLGYRIFSQKILLNGRSKKRFRKKLHLYYKYLATKRWSEQQFQEHTLPLFAFVQHAYTKQLRKIILKQAEKLIEID